jgi:hypothetical protein
MFLARAIAASRRRIDLDIAAFAAASGATDLTGVDALAKYIKSQSLWNNFRCFPMKSAQNAGAGSTVFGFGGLTSNSGTIKNGPDWNAGGISLNGTSQYIEFDDFISGGHLCVFSRITASSATPASTNVVSSQDNGSVFRGWYHLVLTNGSFRLLRSSNGTAIEAYDTGSGLVVTSDQTIVSQWTEGGGRNFWQNKTSRSLSLLSVTTNQTSLVDSAQPIISGARLVNNIAAEFFSGIQTCHAYINGVNLTTIQRESITDLINEL